MILPVFELWQLSKDSRHRTDRYLSSILHMLNQEEYSVFRRKKPCLTFKFHQDITKFDLNT